jgi:hypothetical protein
MGHLLSKIGIKNYRSIKSECFELSYYTPLVGYNNAGKTNILNSIQWLLYKKKLESSDFYDSSKEVCVEGVISGLDSSALHSLDISHRDALSPFIINEELKVRRVQSSPNINATQIKLEVYSNSDWVNGSNVEKALQVLFPEPIFIGAMEDAEEDSSNSKSTTTIGKLLKKLSDPIESQHGSNFNQQLTTLRDMVSANGSSRVAELNNYDKEVNDLITDFFPGIEIKFHIPVPDLKNIFEKGTIKVYESGSNERDISSFGHGTQRSIQMSLIRYLSEKFRDSTCNTTTFLLIDEPELYLHPQAIEILRCSLKDLSDCGYQVVFSTHSPMTISHNDIENAILVRKNDSLGTHKRKTIRGAIQQIEHDSTSQIQLLFSLSNSTQILFSEKVILTEGKSELRLLPSIFEHVNGKTLGYHKIALIEQGGVASTKKCLDILKIMDLPAKAIVDFDFIKLVIKNNILPENDVDIQQIRSHLANIAPSKNILLDNEGWPTKNGNVSASDAFSMLASEVSIQSNIDNLHSKLKGQNIWIWKHGSIEHYLMISKSESGWAQFKSNLNSQPIQDITHDYSEIEDCIRWLIS